LPVGQSLTAFAGAGFVAAITGAGTAVVRIVQKNGG
jgi:hypothetical protein